MPLPRALALIALTLVLEGCAGLLSESAVHSRFVATFGCAAAATSAEGSGYRVQGCGTVAHYECVRVPGEVHHDHHVKPGGGRILASAAVDALFAGLTAREECRLAYVEPRSQHDVSVASEQTDTQSDGKALRLRMAVQGGRVTLFAKPREHPGHVLVALRSTAPLDAAPCELSLYDDGVPLAVSSRQRVDRYEERVLVAPAAFEGVQRSLRFAGHACGFSFELDDDAKRLVARFAVRFAEEVDRGRRTAQR